MGRLLLVDDDPSILRAYAIVLRREGHEVVTARDGDEALEELRGGAFDVIISDVSMPRMSGVELLRAVRQRDLDVPVVLMSAAQDLETALKAVEYGAQRYLAKPVDLKVLAEAVRGAVSLHGLARAKREALELLGAPGKLLGDRAALEVRFESALGSLWMAWQPIVAWGERRVFGYEALVRNAEPTLLRPDDLLAAAERLGRLRDLGRAIRERAAVMAPEAPAGSLLFVNLHVADLEDEQLHSADTPLARISDRVVLEITERASMESLGDAKARVASLRKLGYRIAVDDLGAGYAGLSCFSALEPEVAKLDMSLVRDIDTQHKKQKVVQSMVGLCAELGVRVVTEGVETPAERDALASLGCDLLQGYLFARPDRDFPEPRW